MPVSLATAMIGFALGQGTQTLMGMPPLQRKIAYSANKQWRNALPDTGDLITHVRRGDISPEFFEEAMGAYGFNTSTAWALVFGSRRLLEAYEIAALSRRESWPLEYTKAKLSQIGYQPDEAEEVLRVTKFFPSADDLVRFAVREVYSTKIRADYGLEDDFPPDFSYQAKRAGMDEEQALNYWCAHWILPSLTQGYEMLHRGLISEEELSTLMRTQDIMPFWRENLMKISYMPFTRVDVRRMFLQGTIGEADVLRGYKDLGYDEWHAQKLTEWTVAEKRASQKELTQSMVLTAYEEGELSRDETLSYLQRLGYDSAESELILSLKETDLREAEQKDIIATLKAQFGSGTITEEDFRGELDRLNLKSSYRSRIIATTVREKKAKPALPSRVDLETWLLKGVIDEADYMDKMLQLGFQDEDIKHYLQALGKLPPVKTVQTWLKRKIITAGEFGRYLTIMGFKQAEVARFQAEVLTPEEREKRVAEASARATEEG